MNELHFLKFISFSNKISLLSNNTFANKKFISFLIEIKNMVETFFIFKKFIKIESKNIDNKFF